MSELRDPVASSPMGRFRRYPEYRDSAVEWLGEVPAHWELKRLRFCLDRVPNRHDESLGPDEPVSFVPMDAVGEYGGLRLDSERIPEDIGGGYTFFGDGDVVVAKITPCFENGKGALAEGLTNGVAYGTTELHVMRAGRGMDRRFLFYLSISVTFRKTGEALMYGAGGQKRVPEVFIKDFPSPLPTLEEQQDIAAFLDRETARIDALIEKKRRFIELLQEKRTALISHTVTRGLDPTVPLKDSGIEWLGQIPEHWVVTRVKSVSRFTTSGPRGWSERITGEGSLFIQSGDLNETLGVEFDRAKRVQVSEDAETARTQLCDGDVVVCITGAKTGNVAVCESVPEPAYINQHLCLVRPSPLVLPGYMGLFLKSRIGQTQFEFSQYGLKQGLSLEDVKGAMILLPPMDEQSAIVNYLNLATVKIDALASTTDGAVALLNEYRAALIAAAVTGKIDVREAHPEAA